MSTVTKLRDNIILIQNLGARAIVGRDGAIVMVVSPEILVEGRPLVIEVTVCDTAMDAWANQKEVIGILATETITSRYFDKASEQKHLADVGNNEPLKEKVLPFSKEILDIYREWKDRHDHPPVAYF